MPRQIVDDKGNVISEEMEGDEYLYENGEDGEDWKMSEAMDAQERTAVLLRRMADVIAGNSDWVLVPRKPTDAMRQIGGETNCPLETLTAASNYAVEVYRVMIEAAPKF